MAAGTRVRHTTRPTLGVGRVVKVFAGKPPVCEVVWPVTAKNGQPLWGHYSTRALSEA